MERRRRIGAYGVCLDGEGRVLLVRAASGQSVNAGSWLLPGGGVEHGEHPERTVVREFAKETGLKVAVVGLREVVTDIDQISEPPALRHHDRLIFEVRATGGRLRSESSESSCEAAWFGPEALDDLSLTEHTALVLDRPLSEQVLSVRDQVGRLNAELPVPPAGPWTGRRQRFAAYGLVTDPAGRVLLSLIADGYPGAGHWHLPGGGTDFGESATEGLLRELIEETDQRGEIVALMAASHRHGRNTSRPGHAPVDLHGVRVVFRVSVASPTSPQVNEVSGSTAAAAWYRPEQALKLPLTEIAREYVATLVR